MYIVNDHVILWICSPGLEGGTTWSILTLKHLLLMVSLMWSSWSSHKQLSANWFKFDLVFFHFHTESGMFSFWFNILRILSHVKKCLAHFWIDHFITFTFLYTLTAFRGFCALFYAIKPRILVIIHHPPNKKRSSLNCW